MLDVYPLYQNLNKYIILNVITVFGGNVISKSSYAGKLRCQKRQGSFENHKYGLVHKNGYVVFDVNNMGGGDNIKVYSDSTGDLPQVHIIFEISP